MTASGPRVAVLSSVHEANDPRIFHKQARTLAAAGFDVHLLARHPRAERRDGVWIHALPEPRSRRQRPLQWLRLLWRTLRLHPRVIHIHDPELLPLLLLLKRLTGAVALYDAHEYYAEEVARRAWIPAPLRRPAARLTHRVESFVARRIDAVVAVNEHMAAGFRRRGARSIAVHNFPPVEYFGLGGEPTLTRFASLTPPALPIPGERDPGVTSVDEHPPSPGIGRGVASAASRGEGHSRHALYVGLLSPDRGLATVYQAARLLRERLPDARVRIVGKVDWSGLPPEIPRDPGAWAAAGVEFANMIPAEEVPAAIEAAAVGWIPFLATGNNRRTIPLKLLEYMAAGRPVVASAIGYIAQIVGESGCGLLVPPGDAPAHADALAALLRGPDRARRLGDAGRRAVLDRYTWAGEGARLVALYRDLLGQGAT